MITEVPEKDEAKMVSVIPYTCVYIDADWKHFFQAGYQCLKCLSNRDDIITDIQSFWLTEGNRNHVLPCLSVRTGLDLYLTVKAFPPGSEVIMSAINIPDMIRVVEHHKLKVVPVDVSIETTEVKYELLPQLINEKTVAILVAHVYGKYCHMDPLIEIARRHNLVVIEDCAESFSGFDKVGHPQSDIALFSFGVIKFFTAFGGAIAKVRDNQVYTQMCRLHEQYPVQRRKEYLKKIMKYFVAYLFLNCPNFIKPAMNLTRALNIDHKKIMVGMLRGFPSQMMRNIKQRPSTPLLHMLRMRMQNFNQSEYSTAQVKGEYVRQRLPQDAQLVGMEASVNNYWLFPILVENPDTIVKLLYAMGVDAYRGATQLNMVHPDPSSHIGQITPFDPLYPSEARYLIDHVVYLPVNKSVPFHELNYVCKSVSKAIALSKDAPSVRIQSKL